MGYNTYVFTGEKLKKLYAPFLFLAYFTFYIFKNAGGGWHWQLTNSSLWRNPLHKSPLNLQHPKPLTLSVCLSYPIGSWLLPVCRPSGWTASKFASVSNIKAILILWFTSQLSNLVNECKRQNCPLGCFCKSLLHSIHTWSQLVFSKTFLRVLEAWFNIAYVLAVSSLC